MIPVLLRNEIMVRSNRLLLLMLISILILSIDVCVEKWLLDRLLGCW